MSGEVETLLHELNTTCLDAISDIRGEVKSLKGELTTAKRDRENLELKLGRMNLGMGGVSGGDNEIQRANELKALGTFLRTDDDTELKTLSVGSDPDGGYVTYPAFSSGMTKKLWDQSAIARLARTETITTGDAWEEPLDLDEADAEWVGERSARPETGTPQLGVLRVPVHEIYANQPITQRLLDDAGIDVGAWAEAKIADKFGRKEGAEYISGNGVAKPRGILTYTTATTSDDVRASDQIQYVPTGVSGDFAATQSAVDNLIDVVYKLRAPYKSGPGVAWLMNSVTAGKIRKFKDSTGQLIWQPSAQAGQPASLLGFPVELDENMPDPSSGSYSVAFGNWKLAYVVVQKAGMKLLRDPYSSKPYVRVYAYRRVGGSVSNAEALKSPSEKFRFMTRCLQRAA